MHSEEQKRGYALRGGQFYVNGEQLFVDPLVIQIAVRSHSFRTGRNFDGKDCRIPNALAKRILELERYRSLALLVEEIGQRHQQQDKTAA